MNFRSIKRRLTSLKNIIKENIREGFLYFFIVMSYFCCTKCRSCVCACGNAVIVQYFVKSITIAENRILLTKQQVETTDVNLT